jgi:O-antigen ligase
VFLFIGWTAFSASWAEESQPVLVAVVSYIPNAMLFLIVFNAIRSREEAMWLIGAFVVGVLISGAYGLAVPTDPNAVDRLSGAGGNANETASELVAGLVLAGALAAALRKTPILRLGAALAVPFCAYGVFLTLSRGGLVGLGAALIAAIALAGRWRATAVAVALMLAVGTVVYFGAFAPEESKARVTKVEGGTGRTDVWKIGWRMVEAEPLHGIGAGNFQNTSVHFLLQPGSIRRDDFIVDTPKVAHNTYLEVLAELGVVGLVMFLGILGFALVTAAKAIRTFGRAGDEQMEIISRALLVALIALLASAFFGSREFSKQLWLLMALAPALLAVARAELDKAGRSMGNGRPDQPALAGAVQAGAASSLPGPASAPPR